MFSPIGIRPTQPGGGAPATPQDAAKQQLRALMQRLGVRGPQGLRAAMQQLDPGARQQVRNLVQQARGGAPTANFSQCGGAQQMPAPMPMPMPMPMPGGCPGGFPGGFPGGGQMPMNQSQAVAARVQEAGDRLEAATGIRVPTTVIDDGVKNGQASGNQNTVHTGITPDAAPGVKFHEDAHVLLGDTTNPQGTTMQRELRADQTAGYMLVKAGYGQREIEAFMREAMSLAGGDHGTPEQRGTAVVMGVNQALAEQGLPPIG